MRQLNEQIEGEPAIDSTADYLARYGRYDPQHTWQNVNLSPDFPAVGHVISSLFPQSGGYPIDGVVRVDPYGLAALLKLTGPVEVEPWDVPITAENVVQITLRDAYAAFESENEREDFLSDVGSEVVDRASSGDLGAPGRIAEALGEAAQQGHVALYFTRPDEQDLARVLDADGRMKPVKKDDLLVTTQNAGSNKLDYYLQRSLDYEVLVDPSEDGRTADVKGTLGVTLENTVDPEDELPQTVIGPNVPDLEKGDNLSIVSVYSPLQFEAGAVNGLPLDMSTERENGRNVVSDFFTIPGQRLARLPVRRRRHRRAGAGSLVPARPRRAAHGQPRPGAGADQGPVGMADRRGPRGPRHRVGHGHGPVRGGRTDRRPGPPGALRGPQHLGPPQGRALTAL